MPRPKKHRRKLEDVIENPKHGEKVWEQVNLGPKRVTIDTTKERVVSYEELSQMIQHARDKERQVAFQQGHKVGVKQATENAWSDLAAVWLEVSQALSRASNYALTLSQMNRARLPNREDADKSQQ